MSRYGTQWTLELRDKMSGQLGSLKKRFAETRRESERIPRSVNDLKNKLRSLEQSHNKAYSTKHIRQYRSEIERTRRELGRLQGAEKTRLSSRIGKATSALGISPGAMLGGGLAFGALQIGRNALRDIRELEKAMSNVKAITGATGKEFQLLQETAIKLGADTKFTSIEAADAMTYLGMAGFNTNQIIQALPHTLNLAAAGNIALGRSADIVSNIMGQFGITAYNTDRVVNVLAATATSSNTNIEQLSDAMKYLGPTARSLNMSVEETAAVIGVLGDAGIQGSMAGRALGTSLVNLSNPTEKMKKAMKALSLQAYDANGNFIGMKELLFQIQEGTKKMTQEQRNAALSQLLGNEAFQEINILLERGAENYDKFTQAISGTNKAMEMAATQMDNWAGDIEKMEGAWDSFVQGLNGTEGGITKFFRKITQEATKVIEAISLMNGRLNESNAGDIVKGWEGKAEIKVRKRNIEQFDNLAQSKVDKLSSQTGSDSKTAAKRLIAEEEIRVQKITAEMEKQANVRAVNKFSGSKVIDREVTKEEEEFVPKLIDMLANSKAMIKSLAGVMEKADNGVKTVKPTESDPSTTFDDAESKSKAGIGRVKGEGVKHLTMNVYFSNDIKYTKDEDKSKLKREIEGITDMIVDAGRDGFVTLGDS